ncbi:MAG: TonB-dependent receptor [Pseudomonadota bacterium]
MITTFRKALFSTSGLAAALAASSFGVALPTAAGAQDANDDVIVVSARRREESLQETPVSVSAISGDALLNVGAQDITALSEIVPNITLEVSRGTNTTLTAFIRGVGQQDPVAGFEGGVGIYLDDVYLNRPQAAVLDIYDVERIEVLRGPQGTLYGRNTIGGAVKYVTKRIGDEPEFALRGSYGSFNQQDLVFTAALPINDVVAFGASVASLQRDGFGVNLATGDENYDKDVLAGRISLELTPSDNLFIKISGDVVNDDSSPRQGFRLTDPQPTDIFDTRAGILLEGPLNEATVDASGVQGRIEWNLSDQITLTSITAYRQDESKAPIDFDSLEDPFFDVPAIYENEQFSQELQFTYESDRLSGVAGFYYLDANAFNGFDVILTSVAILTEGDVDTETWAIFGEFTYDLTDALSLTVGGRYTSDERTAAIRRETFLGAPSPFFGNDLAVSLTTPVLDANNNEVVPNFNGNRTDTNFDPRIILAWRATDDVNLYASYSEGFKGGGFDPRGNFANPVVRDGFAPETVQSYEIGVKSTLADGKVVANTAVFYNDYKDVQIPGSEAFDSDGDGTDDSFIGTVTNAGAAEIYGVEFEGTAFVTDELTLFGTLGYISAEYTEFLVNGVDQSDNFDVQNTPDWTASITGDYTTPVPFAGRDGDLSVIVTGAYRGETQQFETPIPVLDQEGFWLLNASLVWNSEDGGLQIGVHGRNLADEEYIVSGYNFPTLGPPNGSVLAFYGNPRTITGTVQVRF